METKAERGHSEEGEEEEEEEIEVGVSEEGFGVFGGFFGRDEEVLERGRGERGYDLRRD